MSSFEGSEKKLELIICPKRNMDLRSFDKSFYERLVHQSSAEILSQISNHNVDAYLLSESSLFVWKDRILMITCGQTQLVDAAKFAVEEIGRRNIGGLIFQRKNEYFSHLQPTNFFDDFRTLNAIIPGRAYRLGRPHGHHHSIFHADAQGVWPVCDDQTTEVLMFDVPLHFRDLFSSAGGKEAIRSFLKLHDLFKEFQVDDFVFSPFGYSLNAIFEDKYFTIHVTPQECSSYISFETNLNMNKEENRERLDHFIRVFSPKSFDLISYNGPEGLLQAQDKDYQIKEIVESDGLAGHGLRFGHFFKPSTETLAPYELHLKD